MNGIGAFIKKKDSKKKKKKKRVRWQELSHFPLCRLTAR